MVQNSVETLVTGVITWQYT